MTEQANDFIKQIERYYKENPNNWQNNLVPRIVIDLKHFLIYLTVGDRTETVNHTQFIALIRILKIPREAKLRLIKGTGTELLIGEML